MNRFRLLFSTKNSIGYIPMNTSNPMFQKDEHNNDLMSVS